MSHELEVLKKQLADTQSALSVGNAKNSAALQTLGQISGDNIDLKASCILMQGNLNELNSVNSGLKVQVAKLQEELKNLQPEATANQLIDLNNELAKLTEENARLNRVVEALDREVNALRQPQEENSDAA